MPTSPPVAICIPTRNQASLIVDALHSAFNQTIMPCDVVISDDAGTDDTASVVEAFRASLPPDQRALLRYDRNPQQLAIGGNFDRAVRLAQGEFVVKLDSDDILEPEFIEVMSAQLQSNPRTGWAHCNVLNIQPSGTPLGLAHTRKHTGVYEAAHALPAYLRHNDTCHCVMIRKSAYLEVGGYRSEMKTAEDWLLWLEMLMGGWGYYFDNRPLARMRKYQARPELMSNRRLNFIESIRFMQLHLAISIREKLTHYQTLSPDEALGIFANSAARLCVSSGCDEAHPDVRRMLFQTACELDNSCRNRLWKIIGNLLPTRATRFFVSLTALPRRGVRCLLRITCKLRSAANHIDCVTPVL